MNVFSKKIVISTETQWNGEIYQIDFSTLLHFARNDEFLKIYIS